ncbi:MAG: 30S ribosomal protein S20 [Actinomycetota bacterium]
MANITSQIKRNRQNRRHEERNRAVRTRLKTEAKKVRTESADAETASTQLRTTGRLLDKAASKGVIHKRTAARRKSKLARATTRSVTQG